ncbi:MAG: hypothetical protein COA78_04535 [Blastopirellula sp.]|nr:MAG: hypothetical protein COA78_04535 [Blastopirellula sp.]
MRVIGLLGTPLLILLMAQIVVAEDESAIRAKIESYVAAFNAGNAAKLADHWAEKGEYLSRSTGERIVGKADIQADFERQIASGDVPKLTVDVESIRFVTADVAIEEGAAHIFYEGEAPIDTTYTAVHVKGNSGWKLDNIRETVLTSPVNDSPKPELADLAWMVGNWADEAEGSVIKTTCRWSSNRNFLIRSFQVHVGNVMEMEGTEVIGWDAAEQTIRGWVFDSDGGFASETWEQRGEGWLIKASGTLADGRKASSMRVIRMIDENNYAAKTVGRAVSGEILPDVGPYVVTRQD